MGSFNGVSGLSYIPFVLDDQTVGLIRSHSLLVYTYILSCLYPLKVQARCPGHQSHLCELSVDRYIGSVGC